MVSLYMTNEKKKTLNYIYLCTCALLIKAPKLLFSIPFAAPPLEPSRKQSRLRRLPLAYRSNFAIRWLYAPSHIH